MAFSLIKGEHEKRLRVISTTAIWLSLLATVLIVVHATNLHAEAQRLENPDGYFGVFPKGIFKIKVTKIPDSSCYDVNFYVVTTKDSRFRAGQLVNQGRWFPSWQQFYTQPYLNFNKYPECNRLAEGHATYSRLIVAEINIPMGGGKTCSGFKKINQAPPSKVPDEKICIELTALDCIAKCTKWKNNDFTETYYVKDRNNAFRIYQYLNSSEYIPPKKTPIVIRVQGSKKSDAVGRRPKTDLETTITGSWKATVDDQDIEMVLWPYSDNEDLFSGYMYVPRHDCLMFANVKKDFDQSAIRYGKFGELLLGFGAHHIKDRKDNCKLIKKNLGGSTFSGGGYINTNKNSDVLSFESQGFYLDKVIASSNSKVKKIDFNFTRCTASKKLIDIIKNSEPPYFGKPYEGFLSDISK